jgi:hypothetical protein
MRTVLLLGRIWQLHVAILPAVVGCVVARHWWHAGATVPTIERAVPMPAVLPVFMTLGLTWGLVERWPDQMRTASRSTIGLRLARYAVVIGLAAAATAVAGTSSQDQETAWLTVIGVGLAGVSEPMLGRWLWAPLVLAGYAWLQYRVHQADHHSLAPDAAIAAMIGLLGACTYALFPTILGRVCRHDGRATNRRRAG